MLLTMMNPNNALLHQTGLPNNADICKLGELRKMACFKNAWWEELNTMSRNKKKAEFEILHTLEGDYSVREYLYAKLLSGDWI